MLCKLVVWFCVGTCECFCRGRLLPLMLCPSHNVLPLAGACLCPICHCGRVVSRKASSSRWQERRWAIICGSPQPQSTDWGSSRKPHLLITVFTRPTPVRSRLSTRQQSQSSPDPAGKDSATSSPMLTEAGTSVRLSFQSRSLLLLTDESNGVTDVRRGDTGQ